MADKFFTTEPHWSYPQSKREWSDRPKYFNSIRHILIQFHNFSLKFKIELILKLKATERLKGEDSEKCLVRREKDKKC